MNLKGEPAYVGRHCGSVEHEVTPEAAALYADALGDHSALPGFAPPLLYHSECFAHSAEWYLQNLFGNLHARQEWDLFAPLRLGSLVLARSTIVARYTKRGRDYVVNETDLVDIAEGRLLVRGRAHQSFLPPARGPGRTGYVVDEQAAKRKEPRAPFPTASGPELAPVRKLVDARRCWLFSGPEKNYHTDVEAAKRLGFPNIVVQGMMSTCFVSQVMQMEFGEGWLVGGRMDVRLTNVLWVDETVTARAKVREEEREGARTRVHCDVWVEKDDATRVLLGTASAVRH